MKQIPSSAISISSNFIFFKSLCGGERSLRLSLSPFINSFIMILVSLCYGLLLSIGQSAHFLKSPICECDFIYCWGSPDEVNTEIFL